MSELTDIVFKKKNIKLELNHGIGDSLRLLLTTYKVPSYCKKHSIKCFVTYGKTRSCGWEELIKDLILRTEIIEYVDKNEFDKIDAMNVENTNIDFKNKYEIIPLEVRLKPEEEFKLDRSKINIALQIRGNDPHKFWSLNKIKELVTNIDMKYDVHMFDNPKYISSIKKEFIDLKNVYCHEWNLAQCYNLVSRCDLLISPDSWSKYVARSYSKKMIILCTKVVYISQETMFKYCFNEIYEHPNTIILGLKKDKSLVDHIDEINVNEIMEKIK